MIDRFTGKKVQSGFPSIDSAERYIARRDANRRWQVACFTQRGLRRVVASSRRRKRRPPKLPTQIRTAIRKSYTGRWGEQSEIARTFDVSHTTIHKILRTAR